MLFLELSMCFKI